MAELLHSYKYVIPNEDGVSKHINMIDGLLIQLAAAITLKKGQTIGVVQQNLEIALNLDPEKSVCWLPDVEGILRPSPLLHHREKFEITIL